MKSHGPTILPFTLFALLSFFRGTALAVNNENFLQCLPLSYDESTSSISQVIYVKKSLSYSSEFDFLRQSLVVRSPLFRKPQVIVKPFNISQIQAVLKCSKENGLEVRVRSGGHDNEGLSYFSEVPFVMIDMINFSSIEIDVEEKTAWVGAGATVGEFYYRIGQKSKNLGFPAGTCPTVGIGGHIGGGGYGFLLRKYGLAIDQVIDAHLIDVNGRILDRKSMGEDLFWAIRGGGVASFGILVAWKVNLVDVPSTVTVFAVQRTLEQNATMILSKWQHITDKLPEDISISAFFGSLANKSTIVVTFPSLFLGGVDRLLPLMQEWFPELGLKRQDCKEMSWVESTAFLSATNFSATNISAPPKLEILINRNITKIYDKIKSDFVRKPMPVKALEGMFDILREGGDQINVMCFGFGGRNSEISETTTPFPHRAGNKFHEFYVVTSPTEEEFQRVFELNRKLFNYLTPYVSKNPRSQYFNLKDLDVGSNNEGNDSTSVKEASVWGKKYFKGNFYRLVSVKSMADPGNFFRNELSIPPLSP